MSTCSLLYFKNGVPELEQEFRNSWGGAAFIWNAMFEKYLKPHSTSPYANWMQAGEELWDLAKRAEIPVRHRAVHASTFDMFIVKRENFDRYCRHLREFADEFQQPDKVCHLREWANAIEACDDDVEAIGFHATYENYEQVLYNLNDGLEHAETYDWLASLQDAVPSDG